MAGRVMSSAVFASVSKSSVVKSEAMVETEAAGLWSQLLGL